MSNTGTATRDSQLSLFDVGMPAPKTLEAALRPLTKIDLHAHLSGCLRLATVRDLIQHYQISVPKKALLDLEGNVSLTQPATSYTASFSPWRRILNRVMEVVTGDPTLIRRVLYEVAEDFSANGIAYAEIRVSPRLPIQNGDLDEFLDTVASTLVDIRKTLPTDIRAVLGFTRHTFYHFSKRDQDRTVDAVLAASEPYRDTAIVGFDLWGNEMRHPPRCFERVFSRIREAGYPLTIHAGEIPSASSIRDAIQRLGARRIGHAVAVYKDRSLLQFLKQHRIVVESCITSNCLTGVVRDPSTHPIRSMLGSGIHAAICVDNSLVYQTNLSKEVARALCFDLIQPTDLPSIWLNAIHGIFASDVSKDRLRRRINNAYNSAALADLESIVTEWKEQ